MVQITGYTDLEFGPDALGSPFGPSWNSDAVITISNVQFTGRNKSGRLIRPIKARVILPGLPKPIQLLGSGMMNSIDLSTVDIAPDVDFNVNGNLPTDQNTSSIDRIKEVVPSMTFEFEYEGGTYRKIYDEDDIDQVIKIIRDRVRQSIQEDERRAMGGFIVRR